MLPGQRALSADQTARRVVPGVIRLFERSKIEGLQLGWLGDDSLLVVIPLAYGGLARILVLPYFSFFRFN